MNAVPSTYNSAAGFDIQAVRPTERETCAVAERVLDENCTVYSDGAGAIVAVAFDESACERLESMMAEDVADVSMNYAGDLCAEALEDLDNERDPRAALEMLRTELIELEEQLASIRRRS
jgi:hypothetical protein